MDDFTRLEQFPSVGPQPAARVNHPLPYPGGPVIELDRQLRRLIALTNQAAASAETSRRETAALLSTLQLDRVSALLSELDVHLDHAVDAITDESHRDRETVLVEVAATRDSLVARVVVAESRIVSLERDLEKSIYTLTTLAETRLWHLFWRSAWQWFNAPLWRSHE